jgi:hypothetical protein
MLTPEALRASVVGSGGTQFSKQFNKGALVVVKHKLHGKLTGCLPLPQLVQLPSLQLPQLVQRTATCALTAHWLPSAAAAAHRLPCAAATSATAIFNSAFFVCPSIASKIL